MEAISTALKIFLEKHFIPTIIALVSAVMIYYFTPDTNEVLMKLGKDWYVLLTAGVVFLIITAFVKIILVIRENINHHKLIKWNQLEGKKQSEQNLRRLWDQVDALSVDDREIINQFLDSGNSPIERGAGFYCSYETLLGSHWVKSRDVKKQTGYCKQYILDDQVYQALKYSKEKYGRIGNFKEEV